MLIIQQFRFHLGKWKDHQLNNQQINSKVEQSWHIRYKLKLQLSGITMNTGVWTQLNAWIFTLWLIKCLTSCMVRPVNFSPQTEQFTQLFSSASMAFWHMGQNTSLFSLSAYIAKYSISSCKIFSYSRNIHCSTTIFFFCQIIANKITWQFMNYKLFVPM